MVCLWIRKECESWFSERPYLIFLSSPSETAVDRLMALGISFRSELLGGFQSRVFDVTADPPDNCQYADDTD